MGEEGAYAKGREEEYHHSLSNLVLKNLLGALVIFSRL